MATAEQQRRYREQIALGERVVPPPKEIPLPPVLTDEQVRDIESRWQVEYRRVISAWLIRQRSTHTRRAYQRAWARWLEWCAAHDIDGINPPDGTGGLWMQDMRAKGYSPASIAQWTVAIRQAMIELSVNGLRSGPDPFARAGKYRVPDVSSVVPITDEDVERLVTAARGISGRHLCAVLLCAVVGLRAFEAGQVSAHTVSRSQWGWVATIVGKGDKRRLVPLPDVVMRAHAIDGWWPGDGRTTNTYELVRNLLTTVNQAAGLHVNAHQLRHWHVTTALREGVPLEKVQDSVGHSDPKTTQRYNRARVVVEGHSAFALERLPAISGWTSA